MIDFNGLWFYQSFCPARGIEKDKSEPQIAAPWSPRGELNVAPGVEIGPSTLCSGSRGARVQVSCGQQQPRNVV